MRRHRCLTSGYQRYQPLTPPCDDSSSSLKRKEFCSDSFRVLQSLLNFIRKGKGGWMYSWTHQKKKRVSFIFLRELNYISLHPVVWINKQSLTNFRLAAVLAGRTFAWKGSANAALSSSHFLLPLTSVLLGLPTSTLPPCQSLSCFLLSSIAFF